MTYDLLHALKALARRPGLSLAVVAILALGIGSTTTIFSITSSVLLSGIPYRQGERLVVLRTVQDKDGSVFRSSYPDIDSWRQQSRTLEQISACSTFQQLNLTGDHRAERVGVAFVSASYFDLLGQRPAMGRTFRAEEENRTSPLAVTVLSHRLWRRNFGGDPAIVGQSIQLQGLAFQVVGVMPADFHDVYPDVDLYVPVTMARLTHRPGFVDDRAARWLDVFARRAPGVTLERARLEMRAISRQLAATFPATDQGYGVSVEPLRTLRFDFKKMRVSILTLLIGAVFVLFVGCTNVVNLLLIRAVERRKEVALRLAFGVTRLRLVRSFILEGALLCLAGSLLGTGAAFFAVRLLAKFGGSAYNLPDFLHFSVDLRALGATVVLATLISFLIGVIPARKSMKVNLQEELQSEGKGHSQSAGTAFTRSFLVVSAIFFSVVLLIGAGLMIKSLGALIQNDPGFRVDRVLSAQFELPMTQYKTDEPAYQLYQRLLDKARALPGVEDAGLWAPGVIGSSFFFKFVVPEGRSLEAPEDKVKVYENRVSPNLLSRMGIAMVKGRDFTAQDNAKHPLVAILSRSAAEAIWPGQDPLG
jgi:putative ABC transport system permease protein